MNMGGIALLRTLVVYLQPMKLLPETKRTGQTQMV